MIHLSRILANRNLDFDDTKYIPLTAEFHSTKQKYHVTTNTNQDNKY